MMRRGGTDDDVAAEIQRAVGTKWAGHQINQVTFVRPKRTMSQIGG
jgi:cyclic pyranopterin phosphate synthase